MEVNKKYQNTIAKGRQEKFNTQQKAVEEEKETCLQIEPEEFKPTTEGVLLPISKLAKKCNAIFKPIIPDYKGCVLNVDEFGALRCVLYFQDSNQPVEEGQIKALESMNPQIGGRNGMNQAQFISNHSQLSRKNKYYKLTDECRAILKPFLGIPRNQDPQWDKREVEQTRNVYNAWGSYSVLLAVEISLQKLVEAIWGRKDKNNTKIDYQVSIMRPLGDPTNTSMAKDWLIQVSRFHNDELVKLASECGLIASDTGIPMYEA